MMSLSSDLFFKNHSVLHDYLELRYLAKKVHCSGHLPNNKKKKISELWPITKHLINIKQKI